MGLTNAAKMFTKLYGVDIARQHGINITHEEFSSLATDPSTLTGMNAFGYDLGQFFSSMNKGIMAEMQ